jgi:hypothetical protein
MTERLDLALESTSIDRDGMNVSVHRIGRFNAVLDEDTARFLAEFIHLLVLPGEYALLGLCPLYEDQWNTITSAGWITLAKRPEKQAGRTTRPAWVVGHAYQREKFTEVFRYGWNVNINEPFIVCIAPATDNGAFLAESEDRGEIYPEHEEILLNVYPTVVSRYYDGLWITLLSTRVDSDQVFEFLHRTAQSAIPATIQRKSKKTR